MEEGRDEHEGQRRGGESQRGMAMQGREGSEGREGRAGREAAKAEKAEKAERAENNVKYM